MNTNFAKEIIFEALKKHSKIDLMNKLDIKYSKYTMASNIGVTKSNNLFRYLLDKVYGIMSPSGDRLKIRLANDLNCLTIEEQKDIVLHELAHAIDYINRPDNNWYDYNAVHDDVFKEICRKLGSNTFSVNIDNFIGFTIPIPSKEKLVKAGDFGTIYIGLPPFTYKEYNG